MGEWGELGERIARLEVGLLELTRRIADMEHADLEQAREARVTPDRIITAAGVVAMIAIELARWKMGAP